VVLVFAGPARATFHEWKIDEIFSNASGTIQFVELSQSAAPDDDERFVQTQTFESASGHSYSFPTNLPGLPGPNSHFLVATPGYAALSGVPAPDFVLPSDNFFSTAGDTLTYTTFALDQFQFGAGQLPTNGTDSLNRAYGSTTLASSPNSPTNFAGQTGSVVPEPAGPAIALFCLASGLLRRRLRQR
jgi:hypothetical protein